MRKINKFIFGRFIAIVLLLLGFILSCNNTNIQITNESESEENIMDIWFSHPFTKVKPESQSNGIDSYKIYMAKNEYEGCQITLRSNEKLSGLDISIAPVINETGDTLSAEILRVHQIETQKNDFYPDPLTPAKPEFILEPEKSLSFFIKLKSEVASVAGDYTSKIIIKQNNEIISTIPFEIKVWNFALPDSSNCATAVGLNKSEISKMHNVSNEIDQNRLYKAYYDYLLDNKICAYTLPYDILDDRADEYLNNPLVTNFIIPYSDDDEVIKSYYNKLSSNSEWFKKGVFYPLDEPRCNEHLYALKDICDRLENLYPSYQIVTPFFLDLQVDNKTDSIDFMTDIVNVWCPKSYMYISSNIYSAEQLNRYPSFGDRMAERKLNGDRVWWYVCWEPGDPYCNMFVDMPGVMHRILFWQQKFYDVDGFLYWSSNYWSDVQDPWTDMRTVKDLSLDVFGDGSLLYNGNKAGIDGPAGSLRIEAIRDGIEDFDMLVIAEKLLGAEFVENHIKQITTSLVKYTRDDDEFASARVALGEALDIVS